MRVLYSKYKVKRSYGASAEFKTQVKYITIEKNSWFLSLVGRFHNLFYYSRPPKLNDKIIGLRFSNRF